MKTLAHAAPPVVLGALAVLTLAACSREPQVVIPRASAPLLAPTDTAKAEESREALMTRLARQEAAARLAEKLDQTSAPARVAEAAPKPAPAPRAAAPEPTPPKAAAAASQPAPEAAKAPPPPEPPKVAAAAPRTEPVRTETPRTNPPQPQLIPAAYRPAAAAAPTRVVNRIEPDFPRAAFQARVERGVVKARMTLDGSGNVTNVEIVDAMPRRVFDAAVMAALAQWKFNDGAAGRTYDTEVVFQR